MKAALDVVTYGEAMAMFVATEAPAISRTRRSSEAGRGRRPERRDRPVAARLPGRLDEPCRPRFVRRLRTRHAGARGIDASCVTVDPRYPTGFQLKSRNDDGSDPTVEYFRKPAASHLSCDDYVADCVLGARHLHLTGVAPAISATSCETAFKLAREMRAAGKNDLVRPEPAPDAVAVRRRDGEDAERARVARGLGAAGHRRRAATDRARHAGRHRGLLSCAGRARCRDQARRGRCVTTGRPTAVTER